MKSLIFPRYFLAVAAIGIGTVLLTGCTNKEAEPVTASSAAPASNAPVPAKNYNEEVQRINNDPNIPEALKAVQMQAAKERFGPGAAGQPQATAPK